MQLVIINYFTEFFTRNINFYSTADKFQKSINVFSLFDAAHEYDPETYTLERVVLAKKRLASSSRRSVFKKVINYVYLILLGLVFSIWRRSPSVLFACNNCFSHEEQRLILQGRRPLHLSTFRPGAFFISSILMNEIGHIDNLKLASKIYKLEKSILRLLLGLFNIHEVVLRNSSFTGAFLIADAAKESKITISIIAHGYLLDPLFLTVFPCLADRYILWTKGQVSLLSSIRDRLDNLQLGDCSFEHFARMLPAKITRLTSVKPSPCIKYGLIASQFYSGNERESSNNSIYFKPLRSMGASLTLFPHPADRSPKVISKIKDFLPDALFATEVVNYSEFDVIIISSISMLFEDKIKNFKGNLIIYPYEVAACFNQTFMDIALELENV